MIEKNLDDSLPVNCGYQNPMLRNVLPMAGQEGRHSSSSSNDHMRDMQDYTYARFKDSVLESGKIEDSEKRFMLKVVDQLRIISPNEEEDLRLVIACLLFTAKSFSQTADSMKKDPLHYIANIRPGTDTLRLALIVGVSNYWTRG